MTTYCFLHVICDKYDYPEDGVRCTPYEKRFGVEFRGPIIPMGAAVTYKPAYDKDKERCHKFGIKTLPAIFIGYVQQEGGGWGETWK